MRNYLKLYTPRDRAIVFIDVMTGRRRQPLAAAMPGGRPARVPKEIRQ
jgi:hypothetical protein